MLLWLRGVGKTVLLNKIEEIADKGINSQRAKKLLVECCALERDKNAYAKSVRLPGGGRNKQRVYKIRPHLIPSTTELVDSD